MANYSPRCVRRRERLSLMAILAMVLVTLMMSAAQAQLTCPAAPTAACSFGAGSVANDYWAGSGSPALTATSITLGARNTGGGGVTTIAIGDLVLLIQMQDADINSSNNNTYGSGAVGNNGSGSTALNSAGSYQFVRATSAAVAGGTLSFTPALAFNLRTRNNTGGTTQGQARWQAIRVPACASATASGVTTPAWNGSSGGVVALDVLGQLTLSGATAIDVAGRGFRGGQGRGLGGDNGANTDYLTLAANNANGSKGEGIAGSPRYMNNVTTFNGAPVVLDNTQEGYPSGSYARGAPGNAGGGATDGNPAANDQNSGAGGGGNYGAGAVGGNSWNSNQPVGGRGGFGYAGSLNFGRVFMGGGGGAGTSNNSTFDNATYTNPPGLACSAGAGLCSSGARGGGIVIVRAGSVAGGGTVDARGADAYNVLNDSAGGGGAGGSVVLQTYSGGSATVNAAGGNGGNAWRSQAIGAAPDNRHGPGGGGGGGFVAYSPSSGFTVISTIAGGISGKTTTTADGYGTGASTGGVSAFDAPVVPGVQPASFCPVAVKAVRLFTDGSNAGQVNPGDTLEYTVIYRNGSGSAIAGFNMTDTLPAALTFVPGSLVITLSGGATGTANPAYNGAATNTLLSAAVSLPPGGVIQATLRATVNSGVTAVCGNITNQANGTTLLLTDSADNTQNSNGLPAITYITQSPAFSIAGANDPTGVVNVCLPSITKLSILISDPVNGTTNPKSIPGAIVEYVLTISNPGVAMTADSVVVTDVIPANTSLCVGAACGGASPVTFAQGTPTSGLAYTFTTLASTTDDVSFSQTATPTTFTYTPAPGANGCDPNVAAIRVNPKGTFADGTASGADPTFTLRFRVCIR